MGDFGRRNKKVDAGGLQGAIGGEWDVLGRREGDKGAETVELFNLNASSCPPNREAS